MVKCTGYALHNCSLLSIMMEENLSIKQKFSFYALEGVMYSPMKRVLANCPSGIGKKEERLNRNESVTESRRTSLSMHPQPIPALPEETIRLAHAVLPEGTVWMQLRDE
jgi:hypothetical protein